MAKIYCVIQIKLNQLVYFRSWFFFLIFFAITHQKYSLYTGSWKKKRQNSEGTAYRYETAVL